MSDGMDSSDNVVWNNVLVFYLEQTLCFGDCKWTQRISARKAE
jgi:hypothetical protein